MSGWMRELERLEDDLKRAEATQPYDPDAFADAYRRLVDAAERRPEIAEICDMPTLYDELSEAYENAGRYEKALTAMERAIATGFRGEPDPRCRLAELHLRFGHPEPAHAIFAQVKTETPDDVWLYNNAGLEYRHSGDFERALGWLDEGLELAMRTDDPEDLVGQLHGLRQECLDALNRPTDDLQRRAASFRPTPRSRGPHLAPVPALASSQASDVPTARGPVAGVSFAWFPRTEFAEAVERWPDLLDGWGVSDVDQYCRALQGQMLQLTAAAPSGRTAPMVSVAPVVLATCLPWCEGRGEDPAAGGTRAAYAADRARTGADDVVAWPPARNERCWCGSGRKYKQCCGSVRLAPSES